jgi:N-hydroxyarylamine O-acetyltransferase
VLAAPFDTYLARLGLDAEPPSADALFRINRAQVERVPYETVWLHMGERWSVDATDSVTRIATQGRGGYCFHLNGALSELLRALGYDVVRHVGGVHGPDGPADDAMTNHLVLTVHGLPTDANPDGNWYVDAGLGDALYEPLPLRAGTYQQGPFRLVLNVTPGGIGDWHLTHDPAGSFTGMSWRSASTELDAFVPRNEFLQTSPESGFVKVLTVQRRDATGVDILRGLMFERVGAGASETTLSTRDEFGDVLGEVFGLDLGAFDTDVRAALWTKLRAAHERWLADGRP